MKKLTTLFLLALSLLHGAVYEVGPGKQIQDPLNLPWNQLTDGDTVRIYYSPEPYRRFMFIGWSNFTVECVRSEDGKRPIFDADGAIGTKKLDFWNWDRGLFRIGESGNPPAKLLENVTIRGCEIRNVWRDKSPQTGVLNKGFTGEDRVSTGPWQPWPDNGAGIQATGVRNIIIEDNYIHDAKIGIAIFGTATRVSQNCVIRNNEFESLGRDDSQSHVTYTECVGETIYGNRSTQPAGWSSVFKTRGICTRIFANYVIGGDRVVDAVDSKFLHTNFDESCPDIIANNFFTRYNANDNNSWIVWGGDSGDQVGYRKSKLYVLNNTFLTQRTLGNHAVEARGPKGQVVFLNNVIQWVKMTRYGFWTFLTSQFASTQNAVELQWGNNWIQTGSCPDPNRNWYFCGGAIDNRAVATNLGGNILAKNMTGEADDAPVTVGPGWDTEYRPLSGSVLIDGGVMPTLAGVDWSFWGTRDVIGGKIDIGAFEFGSTRKPGLQVASATAPPPVVVTPPVITTPSTSTTPTSTTIEETISSLRTVVSNAAKAKKIADDAAAAAQTAITEAKAAAARAEFDATSVADKYVQQIRKVLEDAGLR